MKNLKILALCAGCLALMSCGGAFFIGFVSNPAGNTSFTGTVIAVSTGSASGPDGLTPVTVVTFTGSGVATILYFCGEHPALFPLNQTVRVEFTAGPLCSVLVRVEVVTGSEVSAAIGTEQREREVRLCALLGRGTNNANARRLMLEAACMRPKAS